MELTTAVQLGVVIAAGTAAGRLLYDTAYELLDLVRDLAAAVRDWWDRQPRTTVEQPAATGGGPVGRPVVDETHEHLARPPGTPLATGGRFTPPDAPPPDARARMAEGLWWWNKDTGKLHRAACRHSDGGEPLRFALTMSDAAEWAELLALEPAGCCDPLADTRRIEAEAAGSSPDAEPVDGPELPRDVSGDPDAIPANRIADEPAEAVT